MVQWYMYSFRTDLYLSYMESLLFLILQFCMVQEVQMETQIEGLEEFLEWWRGGRENFGATSRPLLNGWETAL
jgi:hypothetical protein